MKEQKVFPFRARIDRRGSGGMGRERVGWLTTYEVDCLRSRLRDGGGSVQLEVAVPRRTTDEGLAWIRSRFDQVREDGAGVRVERDEEWEYHEAGDRWFGRG